MSDFEQQLQNELKAAAGGVHPHHTDVGQILSDGAQRAKRRQARLAIGGVLMAGVAVVGGVAVLTRDAGTDVSIAAETDVTGPASPDTDRGPEASSTPISPGDGSAVLVPSELTLRAVDVDSSEALGVYSSWGAGLQNGALFEVSTEPGRTTRSQPTLYRSDDGVTWSAASSVPLFPRSIAAGGGSIYAVGTAPSEGRVAKASGGDAAVAVSSDGGTTWDSIELPVDLVAIEDAPGVSSVMVNSLVADGPAGVMVLVQPWAMPDLGDVPGYDPDYGYAYFEDGIGVYGRATGGDVPCAVAASSTVLAPESSNGVVAPASTTVATADSAPIGDPGVSVPTVSTVSEPVGTAGPTVDTTAVECGFSSTEVARLSWAELGADAATVAYLQGRSFFAYVVAADGTVTEAGSFTVDDVTGALSVNNFVATDSDYVLMANTYADDGTTGSLSFTSADGATWTRHDIPTTSYMTGPARWSGGLAGAVQYYDDNGKAVDTQVALSPDGATWSTIDLDPVLDQVSLDGSRWVSGVVGGADGISILVGFQSPEQMGSAGTVPVATAPPDTAPADESIETTAVPYPYSTTSYALLHSTDGVSWSVDVPDELRDVQGPVGIRQAGNQVVVSIQQLSDGQGGLPGQIAVIATPNG